MKHLLAMLIMLGVPACSGPPSRAIAHADFTGDNVFVATILNQETGKTFKPDRQELEKIFLALKGISIPRTAIVEPAHVITLYKGSSFESQKLHVVVDEAGEGYFKQGNGREVMFYSSQLQQIMETYK